MLLIPVTGDDHPDNGGDAVRDVPARPERRDRRCHPDQGAQRIRLSDVKRSGKLRHITRKPAMGYCPVMTSTPRVSGPAPNWQRLKPIVSFRLFPPALVCSVTVADGIH